MFKNTTEQKKFNQEIAMHFCCTATSFTRIEDHPHLLRAVQLLRPGTRLPTRKQLADDSAGGLLETCYQKVKAEVDKVLSANKQFICITSDAWSTVLNEPLVNYMAVSPTKSIFSVPCSDVYKAFLDLENKLNGLTNIAAEKKSYLVKQVKKRFDFMYGDAHGVAYLLDPRYLGDKMSRSLRKEFEDFILNFRIADGRSYNERKEKLAQEYTSFRIKAVKEREQNGFHYQMIGNSKTVLQWWLADGTDWPLLHSLALRVFSMAASSAASERNFSTFGFVHSKLRNRLAPEKAKKLVYIKTNTLQMADQFRECYDPEGESDDPEHEVMESEED